MAAVVHGAQVIVLLHRIHLTVETGNNGSAVGNGVGHTAGLGPQRVTGIV